MHPRPECPRCSAPRSCGRSASERPAAFGRWRGSGGPRTGCYGGWLTAALFHSSWSTSQDERGHLAVTSCLALAHEPLARGADERHRLGEEDAHCVAQRNRLLVRASLRLHLAERGGGELNGRVEGQRGELLALRLGDRFGLPLGELTEPTHQIVGIAAHREAEAAFHAPTVAIPCSSSRRRS